MFVFVFNPQRENVRAFNERVQEFCADHPVVAINATAFGPNLIVQGSVADDMVEEGVPTFTATVRPIDEADAILEEHLDGMIEHEQNKHDAAEAGDGDPNLPVNLIICKGERKSWAVLVCVNGETEDDSDQGGDDGQDGPEDITPEGDPAVGFVAAGN